MEQIQHYDAWARENPDADVILRTAHYLSRIEALAQSQDSSRWGSLLPDAQLQDLVQSHPYAAVKALCRMKEAAQSYFEEFNTLIQDYDYNEMLHHLGHIEFEVVAARRLTEVLRTLHETKR